MSGGPYGPPSGSRTRDVSAALLCGIAGVIILSLQPLAFGPLVVSGAITESQLGQVAGLETAGLALTSALLPGWFSHGPPRLKLALVAVVMALCNLATPFCAHSPLLFPLRMLCGLAEGAILAGCFVVLFSRGDPERMNALFLAVSNSFVAAVSYLIPTLILPMFGAGGSFVLMAAVGTIGAIVALLIRHRPEPMAMPITGWRRWPAGAYLVLAAIVAQNAAVISGWVFLDSTAREHGYGAATLALSAALGIVAQVCGAGSVALFGHRMRAGPALLLGSLVLAGAVFWLGHPGGAVAFVLANMVMGYCWLALLPLSIKLLCEIEQEKQALYLTAAAQMVGLSLGPLIAAGFVSAEDVRPAYWVGMAFGLGAVLLFAAACRAPERAPA